MDDTLRREEKVHSALHSLNNHADDAEREMNEAAEMTKLMEETLQEARRMHAKAAVAWLGAAM